MEKNNKTKNPEKIKKQKQGANTCLLAGAGVGALGVAGAAAGAVCPVCVVVAPALIGIGAFQHWRTSYLSQNSKEPKKKV